MIDPLRARLHETGAALCRLFEGRVRLDHNVAHILEMAKSELARGKKRK
jgi:hypothetical protein